MRAISARTSSRHSSSAAVRSSGSVGVDPAAERTPRERAGGRARWCGSRRRRARPSPPIRNHNHGGDRHRLERRAGRDHHVAVAGRVDDDARLHDLAPALRLEHDRVDAAVGARTRARTTSAGAAARPRRGAGRTTRRRTLRDRTRRSSARRRAARPRSDPSSRQRSTASGVGRAPFARSADSARRRARRAGRRSPGTSPATTWVPHPSSSVSSRLISPNVARPPTNPYRSTSHTSAPRRAAATAAAIPALPAPTTSTSGRPMTGQVACAARAMCRSTRRTLTSRP